MISLLHLHSHPVFTSSTPPFLFIYFNLDVLVVDVQTFVAIFVDDVYTLTDGPSCWNVSLLLRDVETSCQLLIHAE